MALSSHIQVQTVGYCAKGAWVLLHLMGFPFAFVTGIGVVGLNQDCNVRLILSFPNYEADA